MIFSKESIFPYPVLMNENSGYLNGEFIFEIEEFYDSTDEYTFEFSYEITSKFIRELINDEYAELIIIFSSQDNYFEKISKNKNKIIIPRSRLSLLKRTKVQLQIRALKSIYLGSCNELESFYDSYKSDIIIKKNSILGYSNLVEFKGEGTKPFALFETRIDRGLDSKFKIDLSENTIVLVFKDEKYMMKNFNINGNIKNLYLYNGLSRALTQFIINNSDNNDSVELNDITDVVSGLESKIFELLKHKGVEQLTFDNIDSVIYRIADQIIEKFTYTIERSTQFED